MGATRELMCVESYGLPLLHPFWDPLLQHAACAHDEVPGQSEYFTTLSLLQASCLSIGGPR